MNTEQELSKTKLIEIYRFTHSCDEPHRDPKEEWCGKYSINFTEKDQFGLRVGKNDWLMTTKEVFFTKPDLIFSCRHFEEIPNDICFSVCFDEKFVEEIRSVADINLKNYQPSISLNNRLSFLHWKLTHAVLQKNNHLEIQSLAGELFVSTTSQEKPKKLFCQKQRKQHFERVEEVSNLLKASFSENHSLDSISQHVGMSPFHFARTFKELSGLAPHQYLLKIRMEKARELLLENLSVTKTCYAVGFSNFSHFIRSFNRYYGVSPKKIAFKKNP